MADVTVNITGRNEFQSGNPPADDDRGYNLPPNNRLLDEIREEISSQRGKPISDSIEKYKSEKIQEANEEITEKYNRRRADAERRAEEEFNRIDVLTEKNRLDRIKSLGSSSNDPMWIEKIEKESEDSRGRAYDKVIKGKKTELSDISNAEKEERLKVERELGDVIKTLTEEIRRSTADIPSYLNDLKKERQIAIDKRDLATDEASAMEAQRKVNEIEGKIRGVTEVDDKRDVSTYDATLNMMTGAIYGIRNIQSGNIGGVIQSGGSMIAGLSGMGSKSAMKMNAASMIIGEIVNLITDLSGATSQVNPVGQFGSDYSLGLRGAAGRLALSGADENISGVDGYNFTDFGLNRGEFYNRSGQRIRAAGGVGDWRSESIQSIGLERGFALNEGAMVNAAQYDRYGKSSNDALLEMVTLLSEIKNSGVTSGNYAQIQEKLDIQQGLMSSYLRRADSPSYDVANKILGLFSGANVTQDSRMGGDIATFQNMLQNPASERFRATIFQTASNLAPQLKGQTHLLDQYIKNPENESKLLQSVMTNIEGMYGGMNTSAGYWNMMGLTGGQISPDRLKEYLKTIIQGGDISLGQSEQELSRKATENLTLVMSDAAGRTDTITKTIEDWKNKTINFFSDATSFFNRMFEIIGRPKTPISSSNTIQIPGAPFNFQKNK